MTVRPLATRIRSIVLPTTMDRPFWLPTNHPSACSHENPMLTRQTLDIACAPDWYSTVSMHNDRDRNEHGPPARCVNRVFRRVQAMPGIGPGVYGRCTAGANTGLACLLSFSLPGLICPRAALITVLQQGDPSLEYDLTTRESATLMRIDDQPCI